MKFNYCWYGINNQGLKIRGKCVAVDQQELLAKLQMQGISLVSYRRQYALANIQFTPRIHAKMILKFTQQLSLLVQSGLTLSQSLAVIQSQNSHPSMGKMIESLLQAVNQGQSLSQALSNFPKHFDATYTGLIYAGEQSSTLRVQLQKLCHYLQQSQILKNKVLKATYYPATVLLISLLITVGLLLYVVPQFETIYSGLGAKLPNSTLIIMFLSSWIKRNGFYVILTLILITSSARLIYNKHIPTKQLMHYLQLKFPGLGRLILSILVTKWAHIIATTLNAGLTLSEALQISVRANPNLIFQNTIKSFIQQINAGQSFSQSLMEGSLFPTHLIQLIAVAENAGALASMMETISAQEQARLTQLIDTLSQLLEPIIMLLLALLLGFLIIAMYLPVFNLGALL